jgi:formylglycine-generating enzyme required for sulfatase activity
MKKRFIVPIISAILVLFVIAGLTYVFLPREDSPERNCGEGTVIYSGLCWQSSSNERMKVSWEDASEYCDNLELGDNKDWRLPSEEELNLIVETGNKGLAINETYFPGTFPSHYWTSSAYANKDNMHWYVHFETGYQDFAFDFNEYYVRCVRDSFMS